MKGIQFLIFIFFLISCTLIISGVWVPSWGATLALLILNTVTSFISWVHGKN